MTREPRCGVCRSASGIGRNLLTLVVLMLVGMGFTLMSATALAGDDNPQRIAGAADKAATLISLSR